MMPNATLRILPSTVFCNQLHSSSSFTLCSRAISNAVFAEENKKRCQKNLNFDEHFKIMRWMKGKDNLRKAAVLVPLCTVNGVPSLLYTERSRKLTSHRGQVSFPGGLHDDVDDHMIETALRETEEEIGLHKSCVDVWGQMAPVPGKGFETAVTPIIGYCGEIEVVSLQLNKDEVETVFTMSLERLCDPKANGYTMFKKGGYQMPVYTGGPRRIWGLTAIITHLTLRMLVADESIYNLQIVASKRLLK